MKTSIGIRINELPIALISRFGGGGGGPPELVISGDNNFNATDWVAASGVTFVSGVAVYTSVTSGQGLGQGVWNTPADNDGFEASTTYDITVTVSEYTAGALRTRLGNNPSYVNFPASTVGTHTVQYTTAAVPAGVRIQLAVLGATTLKVSKLSIKKAS